MVSQANTPKKWITPSERASKSVPENGVGSCVHFCLRSLGLLERCEIVMVFGCNFQSSEMVLTMAMMTNDAAHAVTMTV